MSASIDRVFSGEDYLRKLEGHYARLIAGSRLHSTTVAGWLTPEIRATLNDVSRRFVAFEDRPIHQDRRPRLPEPPEWVAASLSYKGLICLKSPFDLVLYSNLMWELQPKTILEFGALQGGSSLWFADQLEIQGGDGQVHSFERLDKCIHPRAAHKRLTFHIVDLSDVSNLDKDLLGRLPHPWLVTEDAHENLEQVIPLVSSFMVSGDYYVVEDMLMLACPRTIAIASEFAKRLGFVVDAKYADAFGVNVTCAPNSWFRKT
jgi:cephalosporin hydroxylase